MSRDCWSKGKGKGKSLWNIGDEDNQEEGSQNTPEEYDQSEHNPDVIAIVADAPIRKVCCSNRFKALEDEDEQTKDEEQTKNDGWNPWITVNDKKKNQKSKKVTWKAKQDEQSETNCISCLEDYGQVVEEMICEVTEGSNNEKREMGEHRGRNRQRRSG